MTVVALALSLDRRSEDRLLGDLIERGHTVLARLVSAREMEAALPVYAPEAIVVGAARSTLTAELIAACDHHGVRIVAVAHSDLERRHAASLGLHEVVDETASWIDIEKMLLGSIEVPARIGDATRSPGSPGSGETYAGSSYAGSMHAGSTYAGPTHSGMYAGSVHAGSVIAVWGPAGAPGRTTIAITIAAEVAAAGHTVVLADVDTYSGSVAPTLGMLDEAPGFAAACRLAGADALTRSELERIAQRYNSPKGAFWVLTGIGRPSRWPELSGERVTKTIEVLRDWVDYVVIDTGFNLESDEEISSDLFAPRRNAATVSAIAQADHVVACGLADPVGMARFLRSWVELGEILSTERVSVVMNKVRSSAIGLDPRGQVSATLRRFGGIDAAVLVPHDQFGVDAAVLTGRTLRDAAPKSPARASIRRFVTDELLPTPAPTPRRGRKHPERIPWSFGGRGVGRR